MTTGRFGSAIIATLIAVLSLVSCARDPTAATEANFRPVISAALAEHNPYCVPVGDVGPMGWGPGPFTDELITAGLVVPITPRTPWNLTEKGKAVLTTVPLFVGSRLQACIAEGVTIVEIKDWTEGNAGGISYTQVSYTMLPSKMSSWVTPGILKFLEGIDKKPVPGEILLQKTGKGWRKLE